MLFGCCFSGAAEPKTAEQRTRAHAKEHGCEQHCEQCRTLDNRSVGRVRCLHVQSQCERDRASKTREPDHAHVLHRNPLGLGAASVGDRTKRERVERPSQQAGTKVSPNERPIPEKCIGIRDETEAEIQVDKVLGQERQRREQMLEGMRAGLRDVVHVVMADEDAAEEHCEKPTELAQISGHVAGVGRQQDDRDLVRGMLFERRVRVLEEIGRAVADHASQHHGADADTHELDHHVDRGRDGHLGVPVLHEFLK